MKKPMEEDNPEHALEELAGEPSGRYQRSTLRAAPFAVLLAEALLRRTAALAALKRLRRNASAVTLDNFAGVQAEYRKRKREVRQALAAFIRVRKALERTEGGGVDAEPSGDVLAKLSASGWTFWDL